MHRRRRAARYAYLELPFADRVLLADAAPFPTETNFDVPVVGRTQPALAEAG